MSNAENKPHSSIEYKLIAKCINSGVAAIISTLLVFPLDLSKTRLQSQRNTPDSVNLYTSLADCLRKIIKTEGMRGLYRGCTVNLIFIAPEKTVKLVSNDFMRRYLKSGNKNQPLLIKHEIIAGGVAGAAQSFISTPMDLMKINLQDAGRLAHMNNSSVETTLSARKVALDAIKTNGIFSLWRGIGATMGRNVFFSVIYFPAFYTINRLGPKKSIESSDPSSSWAFFSGCAAGALAANLATPLDVIKTRLQRIRLSKCDEHYNGLLDAFLKIIRTEGPLALMKGAGLRMATIAPLFGILQTVYYLGIGEFLLDVSDDDD